MIKVVFKDAYNNAYKTQEYTYKDYEGGAVGDIVVVNTRNGYAIAKITQIDVEDYNYNEDSLSTVVKTIITQKEIETTKRVEALKKQEVELMIKKLRRNQLINEIGKHLTDYEKTVLEGMNDTQLETIYESLKSF